MRARGVFGLIVAVGLLGIGVRPVSAEQVCQAFDQSTEEVLPGVTLTWDSSVLCADAPDEDSLSFTVTIASAAGSAEAVTIDDLTLTHTTPRPRGQAPEASGTATGLPLTIEPGGSGSFTVSGSYQLVTTGEGAKANLHFQAGGQGSESGEPFALGVNALVRGAGAIESGGEDNEENGPPDWVPGPPPWAEKRGPQGDG